MEMKCFVHVDFLLPGQGGRKNRPNEIIFRFYAGKTNNNEIVIESGV